MRGIVEPRTAPGMPEQSAASIGRVPSSESLAEPDVEDAKHGSVGSRPPRRVSRPPLYIWEPALLPFLLPIMTKHNEIETLLSFFWYPAAVFAIAEVLSLVAIRKSVFVAITAKAFEMGPDYAKIVELHIWASAAMWALAATQVLGERFRKNPSTAWVHRRGGQAMLVVYFVIVFPTSIYLSVKQRIEYLSWAVVCVLFDTAICTAYFLYRGWRVARVRRRGDGTSLALHGRLMQCGVMMSMSILPQRMFQFYLTFLQSPGIVPWAQSGDGGDHAGHQLNYTISILVTSIAYLLCGHLTNGPRGGIWVACIGIEHAEEAYGSARPSRFEWLAWRFRWFVYVVLYYFASQAVGPAPPIVAD